MKRENKHCIERKKGVPESNRMVLIHSNVSKEMTLIHSNISKFFKKQHTNTLGCFANRRSFNESSNSIDEKFFLKKIELTRFIGRFLPFTNIEGQSKEWANINREYFFKSYR